MYWPKPGCGSYALILLLSVLLLPAKGARGQTPSKEAGDQANAITALKVPVPETEPHAGPEKHPLQPVLALALKGHEKIRRDIRDYTCVMVRRERVDGQLRDHEFMYAKVRHRQEQEDRVVVPFSVYLRFAKPNHVRGREVLYVEGQYDSEMFVRRGGQRFAFVTTKLDPQGELAMRDNRYPITEFGIENLTRRLVQVIRQDMNSPCDVRLHPDAKLDDRPCVAVVVTHRDRETASQYYQARVLVDKQLKLPVHYEAYDWPEGESSEPVLLEQYTYSKIRLNVGLTDADFDPAVYRLN